MLDEFEIFSREELDFDWSPWLSLHPDDNEISTLSTDPGLYLIRHEAYEGLVYIGETGRSLRGRISSLARGIHDEKMPYSDPHTGSPSLWAIVNEHGPGFEVSGATPPEAEDDQQRKAIEDTLIALHRKETETNLVGNFGRMPPGYSKSKKRSTGIRGEKTDDLTLRSFREGTDPLSWDNSDGITDSDWLGLSWSATKPLEDAPNDAPDEGGIYRIWDHNQCPPLEYLGETVSLSSRLKSHRRNREGTLLFSYAVLTEASEKFQLSQIESELLGADWLACGRAPRDQY